MITLYLFLYFMLSCIPYFAMAERSGFGVYPMILDLPYNWTRWKDSYILRTSTKQNDKVYPTHRVCERKNAIIVMRTLGGVFIGFFWPIAIVLFLLYLVYKIIKSVFVFLANIPKIIDSIKGE